MNMVLYIPSAPSHGAAKGWVRNVNVWVLRLPDGVTRPTCIRDPRIISKRLFASEVDSRYDGPKSRYGQALIEAHAYMATHIPIAKVLEVEEAITW